MTRSASAQLTKRNGPLPTGRGRPSPLPLHGRRGDLEAGAVRQRQQQGGVGRLQADGDLRGVVHRDLVDRRDVALHVRVRGGAGAVEVELGCGGVERGAVVESDALAQLHHDRGRALELPALGEAGARSERLRVPVHQAVVERVQERMVGAGDPGDRVERIGVAGGGDLEDTAAAAFLSAQHGWSGEQRRGDAQQVAAAVARGARWLCSAHGRSLFSLRRSGEMAGSGVPVRVRPPSRIGLCADGLGDRAARAEAAAGGRRHRTRHLALQDDAARGAHL